jgi:hypothetical protein
VEDQAASSTGKPRRDAEYALCVGNKGNEASLCLGKLYRVVRPLRGDEPYDLRVIDEEGEDYLYPAEWFLPIALPPRAKKALRAANF